MSLLSASRRSRAATLPLSVLVSLAVASTVLGAYWAPVRTVSGGVPGYAADLAANGSRVAAAWTTSDTDPQRRLLVAVSADRGDHFGAGARVAADPTRHVVPGIALASAGGRDWLAFAEKRGVPGDQAREQVFLASKPYGSAAWSVKPVSSSDDLRHSPDVAYTPSRVFVSYVARIGGAWRVLVESSPDAGATFEAPLTLGASGDSPPAIGATATTVSAVWNASGLPSASGSIQLRRGRIGGAPNHVVTWGAARTVGRGSYPAIAVDGSRLGVFYVRQTDVFVRLSSNGGATFGPERRILDGDETGQPGQPRFWNVDAAIAGSRVVAVSKGLVRGGADVFWRATSNNAGTGWSTVSEAGGSQVAFVGTTSAPRICEAWSDASHVVRYRRQA
jgi:hypothetical protein